MAKYFYIPLFYSFIALILCGCATAPSQQEMAFADYGPYPDEYQEKVKSLFAKTLRDPYSAVYEFQTPKMGYAYNGLIHGGGYTFGWIVQVGVNAKNGFGGYVGEQTYYFMFERDQWEDITMSMGVNANYAHTNAVSSSHAASSSQSNQILTPEQWLISHPSNSTNAGS